MTFRSAYKPNRRRVAFQLLALQVFAAGLAPIAHATAEVIGTERSVEAGHTSQCAFVHNERVCTFTANAHFAQVSRRVSPPTTQPHRIDASHGTVHRVGSHVRACCNGERAPPRRLFS